jgi:hypothetical protein
MEVRILFSKKRGFFSLLPLGFNTMQFRILISTSRSSKLPPSSESSHREVNRVRMWLNCIGELQEVSLIRIMGKEEERDDWTLPLQLRIQSNHLFYSYFSSPPLCNYSPLYSLTTSTFFLHWFLSGALVLQASIPRICIACSMLSNHLTERSCT